MGATHVLKHLRFLAIILLSRGFLRYKRLSKQHNILITYNNPTSAHGLKM